MKEVKFRFWNKNLKKMYCPDLEELFIDEGMLYLGDNISHSIFLENYIWLQFTGFYDKNGKEIYFGDIVKFTFDDKNDKKAFEQGIALIIHTMNFGAGLLYNDQIQDLWDDPDLWTIEVIGNEYENPELLN